MGLKFSYTYPHLPQGFQEPFISILISQGNKKEDGKIRRDRNRHPSRLDNFQEGMVLFHSNINRRLNIIGVQSKERDDFKKRKGNIWYNIKKHLGFLPSGLVPGETEHRYFP
jgi:hypothetical protein